MSGSATRDWDAGTYDRVSDPQVAMALGVLDRLDLRGDETVLDAGCGSGRVTRLLLERVPRGRVIAVDGSASMVTAAREALPPGVEVFQSDLVEVAVPEPVDAVFSNAVFHWIADHDALFARVHAALEPGGQLVAQCGGEGNIAAFVATLKEVGSREPYAPYLEGRDTPWNYASPEETERRLRKAGFTNARCWRTDVSVEPQDPRAYTHNVCLGAHREHLPEHLREQFTDDVLREAGQPLKLAYVRLNIDARA